MKIELADRADTEKELKILEEIDLSDEKYESVAPVAAGVIISRQEKSIYALRGSFTATIATSCDRCGRKMTFPLSREFSYSYRLEEEPEVPDEYDSSEDDCEVVYLTRPVVDSSLFLSEQLLLAMPFQTLCNPDCKGLCDGCGVDLNDEKCRCDGVNHDSPFAVLRKITTAT